MTVIGMMIFGIVLIGAALGASLHGEDPEMFFIAGNMWLIGSIFVDKMGKN